MKITKKIISGALALSLSLSSMVSAETFRKVIYMSEDFETYAGGTTGIKLRTVMSDIPAEKADISFLSGVSFGMMFDNYNFSAGQSKEPFLYYTYSTTETFSWGADMYFEKAPASGGFVVVAKNPTGGSVYLQNVRFIAGELVIYDGKTEYKKFTLGSDKKYQLEYEIDMTDKTFDFYLDGERVAEGLALESSNIASISQLRLIAGHTSETKGNVYIDNFVIKEYSDIPNAKPEISWDLGGEINLNEQEFITVTASDPDGKIEKVELYLNGVLCDTKVSAPYKFDMVEYELGKYSVKVIAYDNDGATSMTEKETNIIKPEIEKITVTTNLTKDSYDCSTLEDIEIYTAGNTGELEKAILYVDGVLKEKIIKAPFNFSKDNLTPGKHNLKIVVYDKDYNKGSYTKDILITQRINTPWFSDDFEGYTGGNSSASALSIQNPDFNATAEVIDEKYGTSIRFSKPLEEITKDTVSSYVMYSPNTSDSFIWKTSIMFEKFPVSLGYMMVVAKNSTGGTLYMQNLMVKENKLQCYNGSSVAATMELEEGRFYDIEYTLNNVSKTYSLKIDGKTIAENFQYTSNDVQSVSQLRLGAEYQKGEGIGFALDNFELIKTAELPNIEQASEENETTVKLTVTDASNITADDVSISDMSGELKIDSIEKEENTVYIKLSEALNSDTYYTVSLKPCVILNDTKNYGEISTISFKTGMGESGVKDVKFSSPEGILNAEITLYNKIQTDKNALAILNVYKDGKIIDFVAKSVLLNESEKTFTVTSKLYDNSCDVKLFFLNSWQERNSFNNNLYQY